MKVPPDRPFGFYHCISRVVDRRFIFNPREKEHFRLLLRECEAFCQVRVLTYCLMSNHFHILLEVPRRPEVLPSAEEVLGRLEKLSGHQNVGALRQQLALYREQGDAAGEAACLEGFYARMWDLSAFMKLLKQRFTQWYNAVHERKGTLWEDRFKSVLVEGRGRTLATMAAYIDLNPVRAGVVEDPKEYRWSGYGEAVAGVRKAREGLKRVVSGLAGGGEVTLKEALAEYRKYLYLEGNEEREGLDEEGRPVRGVLKREEVVAVLGRKARLQVGEYLRCRVRYFCDGAVLGSRGFVEEIFGVYRARFGAKRKDGARRLRGLAGAELYALRNLRVNVFG